MPALYYDVGVIGYHLFDFLKITGLKTAFIGTLYIRTLVLQR